MNEEKRHLRSLLSERIGLGQVSHLCAMARDEENSGIIDTLYELSADGNARVAANALWTLTHLDETLAQQLRNRQTELMQRAITETNTTHLRLILTLLLAMPYNANDLSPEFLDFCFEHIPSTSQPYAVRVQCMKLAFMQCRHYRELTDELERLLELMSDEPLSPGLVSARRQVMHKIKVLRKKGWK